MKNKGIQIKKILNTLTSQIPLILKENHNSRFVFVIMSQDSRDL
jgi:hypothetical protein